MTKAPKIPRGARTLRTYRELELYLEEFAAGQRPFVWLFGRPGISKTESIRAAMHGREVLYLKGGQLTAAELYRLAYIHRGQPILLDDAEHLLEEKSGIGKKLISALGETRSPKQLNYGTLRGIDGAPPSYLTTSNLCIIANKLSSDPAIQSRALILHFAPANAEVHQATTRWFWDQEIHDWIGERLACLGVLEMRDYLAAATDKAAGRDWRRHLLDACATKGGRLAAIVQEVEGDTEQAANKWQRFLELAKSRGIGKGASRATYFRLRAKLEEEGMLAGGVPRTVLRHQRPPAPVTQAEADALADPATAPGEPVPEAPPDLPVAPARADFARPITGASTSPAPGAARPHLDDTVPGERSGPDDDEGDPGNP